MLKCKLFEILHEKKMTQSELAKITGISLFTINAIYNEKPGMQNVQASTFLKISHALNIKLTDLIEEE